MLNNRYLFIEMVMSVDVMNMRIEIKTEIESQRYLFNYNNNGNKIAWHFVIRNFEEFLKD